MMRFTATYGKRIRTEMVKYIYICIYSFFIYTSQLNFRLELKNFTLDKSSALTHTMSRFPSSSLS